MGLIDFALLYTLIQYIHFYHFSSTASTRTDKTTTSSIVTSDGHQLHTNSTPLSTDVTFSITESMSPPSSTDSGTGNALQSTMSTQVSNDVTLNITESPSSTNGREIGNTVQGTYDTYSYTHFSVTKK